MRIDQKTLALFEDRVSCPFLWSYRTKKWEQMYTMGNFTNGDDAGELVPIAQRMRDLIHEVVLFWLVTEWREPFHIRKMLWDIDMREEELLDDIWF